MLKINKSDKKKPCPVKGHAALQHLPLGEDDSITSALHTVSSNDSAGDTRGTTSISLNSGSTKGVNSNDI